MPKWASHIFILTLLIMVFFLGVEATDLSGPAYIMACPDLPLLDCEKDDDYLLKEGNSYLLNSIFFLIRVNNTAFHDQGFVKSLFRPPTSIVKI
jgi:hypothetical protein